MKPFPKLSAKSVAFCIPLGSRILIFGQNIKDYLSWGIIQLSIRGQQMTWSRISLPLKTAWPNYNLSSFSTKCIYFFWMPQSFLKLETQCLYIWIVFSVSYSFPQYCSSWIWLTFIYFDWNIEAIDRISKRKEFVYSSCNIPIECKLFEILDFKYRRKGKRICGYSCLCSLFHKLDTYKCMKRFNT